MHYIDSDFRDRLELTEGFVAGQGAMLHSAVTPAALLRLLPALQIFNAPHTFTPWGQTGVGLGVLWCAGLQGNTVL